MLGRRRAGGKALVAVHRMAEGVVAFADEAAAERFGEELEAAGHGDVSLATVDSHQLFRLTGLRCRRFPRCPPRPPPPPPPPPPPNYL